MIISIFASEFEVLFVPQCHELLQDAEAAIQEKKIYIWKELDENERITALLHEIFHGLWPWMEEERVHNQSQMLADTLLANDMIRMPE